MTAVSAPEAPKTKPRLDFIDGVRGLACFYIVAHHLFLTLYPVLWHEDARVALRAAWWSPAAGWLQLGHYAVTAFIVLSGYCLMMPVVKDGLLRGGAKSFYTRRLARILPTYFAAIVFCSIVDVLGHVGGHVTVRTIVTHVLLINNWMRDDGINGAFWFIATQAQLYVLFPAMVWVWRKLGPVASTVTMLVMSTSAFLIFKDYVSWSTCLHYGGLFAVGMFAANVSFSTQERWAQLRTNAPWGRISAATLAAVFVVSTVWFDSVMAFSRIMALADLLVGIVTSTGLIAAARATNTPLRRFLELRPLVGLGTFSYSLYLIHTQLFAVARVHLPYTTDTRVAAIMVFILTPLAVAVGWLFYLLFEKPVGAARAKASKTAA
ncbi:MAG TPA: acyltransferase [Capsulimonadaceae bacterium]|jgi:peptidoglycan/LPS O-acetylase OafA/YrhL